MQIHAVRLLEYGKPLKVEDVDIGEASDGDVVVDMAFGGVNPVDRYAAMGRLPGGSPPPRTLGVEGSGTLDGLPVMVRGYGIGSTRDGLWSTRALVPKASVINVPDGVDLASAAAMGVAGVTAWRMVTEKAKVTENDRVLVLGASGGVGSMVVSVAHALGAIVWGQTTNQSKADWIKQRGADRVVVANAADLADTARELHPTVVIDPLGGEYTGACIELLEPRGRLAIFGTSAGDNGNVPLQSLYGKAITVYGYAGLIEDDKVLAGHIANALNALRDHRLAVTVDRIMAPEEINDAFRLLGEQGVQGKLLVDLSG